VSDHGTEGRYPFLDESVVSFLNGLRVDERCDLRLERGLGEKLLLRGLAFQLGLGQVLNGLFTRTVILTVSDATAASNTAQK
jgi:asparagine synthetase B (glutamine-hydrolysing)